MNFNVFLGTIYDDLVSKRILTEQIPPKDLNEKIARLNAYLEKLERVNKKAIEKKEYINRLKKLYYDKYLIKEESIPDSYWHHLEQKYLDNGYGKYNLVEPKTYEDRSLKEGHITQIRNEQMDSLDSWLNYLMSPDSDYLPMWAKVWAFSGMLKIGNLNDDKTEYLRRSKTAVNPFVTIDSELLGKSVEYLKAYLNNEELPEEIKEHIKNKNFNQIYGYLLANKREIKIQGDEGIWIKYLQESKEDIKRKEEKGEEPNYLKLYNSLQGYNTGWCTAASKETAKSQVLDGNFYVYYTKNEFKEYVIPRIAIRMEERAIAEIRGIAQGQNLEPNMERTVSEKLEEFPNKDKYLKKVKDMEMITKIYNEYKTRKLTKEELRFLYEIDEEILGFGYSKDPRIQEILAGRNIKQDLAKVFNCHENQISLTEEEAFSGNSLYHYGNLDLAGPLKDITTFPKKILKGTISASLLSRMERVIFPEDVDFDFNFPVLNSLKDVTFPKKINSNMGLGSIEHLENVTFPEEVVGNLDLASLTLTSLEGVTLPKIIGGSLDLTFLTSLKDVTFPETIEGDLDLRSLTSLEGVSLPEIIGDTLYLPNIAFEDLLNIQLPKFKEIHLANNVRYTYEECMEELAKLKLANIKNETETLLTAQQNLMEIKEAEDGLKR